MDGGIVIVYLTLFVTATGLLVTLSKNLQEVLGPFGRWLKARRERAEAKGIARMAAAATVADSVIISELRADNAWGLSQNQKLTERVEDLEEQARADAKRAELAEVEVRRVRAEYGRELDRLNAQVDRLKLGRPPTDS